MKISKHMIEVSCLSMAEVMRENDPKTQVKETDLSRQKNLIIELNIFEDQLS